MTCACCGTSLAAPCRHPAHRWHQVTMMMRPPGSHTRASSPTKRSLSGLRIMQPGVKLMTRRTVEPTAALASKAVRECVAAVCVWLDVTQHTRPWSVYGRQPVAAVRRPGSLQRTCARRSPCSR